ncbi:hypothetical protein, partial [Fangia hongkongensis]
HLRFVTFANDINSDKNDSNAYVNATISSNTQLAACPSNPSDDSDCDSFGDCYYLAKPTAIYGQVIKLNICSKIKANKDIKAVILNFTNIVDNTSYDVGTANCRVKYQDHDTRKMECSFNTENTDYKIEDKNKHKTPHNGKDKTYKIIEDS